MIPNAFFSNKVFQWCGALLLVLSFLVISYSPSLMPSRVEKAEAQWAVFDATAALNAVKDWIISKAQQLLVWIQTNKEMVLDGLAWVVINVILEKMSQDIIKWINSGFKGRPAFVQNYKSYFLDIADRVVGDAIWKTDFKFLCSPFALNVQLALELQYTKGRGNDYKFASQCTLSEVFDNTTDFFNGKFPSKGWGSWMKITTKPQNNPFGALALGSAHLNTKLGSQKKEKSEALTWGRGLMSTEVCTDYIDDSAEGDGQTYEICKTVTPGAAIQDQLSRTLSIPVERLTVADEFNEMLNALFNQLVKRAFEGAGGLLGVTEKNIAGVPNTGTYFSEVANTASSQNRVNDTDSILEAIRLEQRYLEMLVIRLNLVLAAQNYKNDRYGINDQCHSGILNPNLSALKTELQTKVQDSIALIAELQAMINSYTNLGSNQAEEKLAIMREFTNLLATQKLHNEIDIAILEQEVPNNPLAISNINTAIDNFKREVDIACVINYWNAYWQGGGGGD